MKITTINSTFFLSMFLAVFLVVFSMQSSASTNDDAESHDENVVLESIKNRANKLLNDSRFNAVSIGVVKNGQTYTKHFGELTPGKGNVPNDNTRYEIASVSKTMTGLLIAKAVKEGRLSLDKNIALYLKEPMDVISPEQNPLTIKQLLTHSSGMPRDVDELPLDVKTLDRKQFIAALNKLDITGNKHKFTYSSVGTELLCYILESVYQKPFEQLLVSYLSTSTGMNDTKINLTSDELADFAYGYNDKKELMPVHTKTEILWGGSSKVKTTMADMVRYMTLQLDSENAVIIESHQKLFHAGGSDSISYQWIAADADRSGTYYLHHGGMEGTQNWLMIFPAYKMAVSVITNTSFEAAAGLIKEVALGIVDDVKPFGIKSVSLAISTACIKNADGCIEQYQQLKHCCYADYRFDNPQELNIVGYKLLNQDKTSASIAVFTLLTQEFPTNANAFDSLGEAYFHAKKYELASSSFKKSLLLNPANGNAKNMLKKLSNS